MGNGCNCPNIKKEQINDDLKDEKGDDAPQVNNNSLEVQKTLSKLNTVKKKKNEFLKK